jgi:pilus assembly protein CpaC
MYVRPTARALRSFAGIATLTMVGAAAWFPLAAQEAPGGSLIRTITKANERLEMTVNSSQVLTLESRIPRLVVNNPELVSATPISENQVQIAARKPGVTQVNLWDEKGQVYTVDLLIFGDVRELELTLKSMFPASALKVRRLTNSLVLEGQVDRPEIVSTIRMLAEDYAPKIINNITVGGAQQVALKVKVMEVSRTKLRRMGFDWALFQGDDFLISSVSDILRSGEGGGVVSNGNETLAFGIVDGNTAFFGLLEALQENRVAKILADPTITTVSGRPAKFLVGGETPIQVPAGLGMVGIEYREFGTQVDFVPIVLGNGRIRLEVRPRVSALDFNASTIPGVPGFNVREVDCGVEMNAGQTLALAGLIQEKVDSSQRGIPFLGDLPLIGAAFRKVEEDVNEVELLIVVTPEFVEGMDACEAPICGPGMETMSPTHSDLYCKGFIEVPTCGPCGAVHAPGACPTGTCPTPNGAAMPAEMLPTPLEGAGPQLMPTPPTGPAAYVEDAAITPTPPGAQPPAPASTLPQVVPQPQALPNGPAGGEPLPEPQASKPRRVPQAPRAAAQSGAQWRPASQPARAPEPSLIGPTGTPVDRQARNIPQRSTSTPGLIGPVGYDVQK